MLHDRVDDANEWRQTLAVAREWERNNAPSVFSRLAIARAFARIGDPESAILATNDADHFAQGPVEEALSSLVRGEVEIRRKNWGAAAAAYDSALERNPSANCAEIRRNLATTYFELRRWDEAERTLLDARQKYKTEGSGEQLAMLLSNIGFMQMLQGRLKEAEETLQASLAVDRGDVVTRQNVAILQTLKGEYLQAEQTLSAVEPSLRVGSTDFRRNEFLKAWSRLRNPVGPEYKVLMALQEADGIKPDESKAKEVAASASSLVAEMTFGADLAKANEGTYGLESIEADFLRRALAYQADSVKRDLVQARLDALPPAVIEIANIGGHASSTSIVVTFAVTSTDIPANEAKCASSTNGAPPVLRRNGDALALEPGDVLDLTSGTPDYAATPNRVVIAKGSRRIDVTVSRVPREP